MRVTKIIATIGTASQRSGVLIPMTQQGMNIARLNFSHENEKIHTERMKLIRKLNSIHEADVKIMLDLKGPEVRLWGMEKPVELKKDDTITLSEQSGPKKIKLSNPSIIKKLDVGSKVLIDDGYAELMVVQKSKIEVICKALDNCTLKPRKSVGSEFVTLGQKAIIQDDINAIKCGVREKADYIAVSHVRNAKDMEEARSLCKKSDIQLVAKIENFEAIKNIRSIIEASDGIMVARGDMGINIPLWYVPLVQEHIIKLCTRANVFSIVATQMMESMVANRRPTRAEVTDVYTAVKQGAKAVMLSGETAVGNYPVETIEYMRKIIETAESSAALQLNEISRPH